MTLTIPQVAQYAAYLVLLMIAGALEYFKLLPAGTVGGLFLLIVGHFFGNTPAVLALNQNTVATKENTVATGVVAQAVAPEVMTPPPPAVHHASKPATLDTSPKVS
jgi:hypothetical protein